MKPIWIFFILNVLYDIKQSLKLSIQKEINFMRKVVSEGVSAVGEEVNNWRLAFKRNKEKFSSELSNRYHYLTKRKNHSTYDYVKL